MIHIKMLKKFKIYVMSFSRLQPKRVFQTVKNLNLMRQQRSSLAPSPLNIPGSNQTSCLTSGRSSRVGTPLSLSMYGSEMGSGIILDNRTSSILESSDDGYGQIDSATHILEFYVLDFDILFLVVYLLLSPVTKAMPLTTNSFGLFCVYVSPWCL